MPINFQRDDLLEDISERELTAIAARIPYSGEADPITASIARAQALVERYTARYAPDADAAKGYVRDLALYYLMERVMDAPSERQIAYEQTMTELRDIRDGKYPNLPLSADADATADADEPPPWGSAPKVGVNPDQATRGGCAP